MRRTTLGEYDTADPSLQTACEIVVLPTPVPAPRSTPVAPPAAAVAAPPVVTVALPVFNEARVVRHTFAAVAAFARQAPHFHFIFVDDGSADDTVAILRERIVAAELPNLGLIQHAHNRGKCHAIRTAIAHAQGDLFIFTDGDLAYPLDHLPHLVEELSRHEMVIGSRDLATRHQKNTKVLRRVLGWTFNKIARTILWMPYRDTQAGLKGFRLDAARRIFALQHVTGYSFDAELIFIARRLGYSVGEIPARVSDTHSYKVSKVNLAREPFRMLRELVRIRGNALLGRYGRRAKG